MRYMDQTILIDAIGKHLDLLEKLTTWALLVSLAIGWAGLQKKDISALGMTFSRKEAFAAASALYLFANMIIVILFLRLGDLLLMIDDKGFAQAVTKLSSHTWIMNPYAYFGSTASARSYSYEGLGILIVLWWVCHASLSTLADGSQTRRQTILVGGFLLIGLGAMQSANRVFGIVLDRGSSILPPQVSAAMMSTIPERTVATFLGIGIGGLLFFIVRLLQRRYSIASPS
jgi:hypothetical protein